MTEKQPPPDAFLAAVREGLADADAGRVLSTSAVRERLTATRPRPRPPRS